MPEKLGRFRILEPLGADFIGSRYLAFDPQINRQVVLRTLDPGSEDAEGLVREHFLQEARTAARLSHPNIIKVFGIHTGETLPFAVLENLEGPSLEQLLKEAGPLPPERTARLIALVADALEYAHAEGVIHRDVRPGAIVVLAGDQPVLTGFLMAKMADLVSAVTRQGLAVGTPGYAAPELVTGGIADLRGDIFSLGAVIYEMLTGRQAFVGQNMAETLYRLAHTDPDPPSSVTPGLDDRHDRLVLRALAKSPSQRHRSMGELRTELEAWLDPGAAVTASPDDTDEIAPGLRPSGADDTDRLPVMGQVRTADGSPPDPETEPGPEPEHEFEPEPEPIETLAASSAVSGVDSESEPRLPERTGDSGKVIRPGPSSAIREGTPAPSERRRRLVPVMAAAAVILLASVLAAWQLGWFRSSPAERAGSHEGDPPRVTGRRADADPAGVGGERDLITRQKEEGQVGEESSGPGLQPFAEVTESIQKEVSAGGEDPGEPDSALEPPGELAVPPPTPTGVLEVASEPWARVTLDDRPRGETPLRIDGVTEGEHRLLLVSVGGTRWSGTVTIRGNRSTYHFHNFREDG